MVRRRRPPRPGALSELPPLRILSQIAALQTLYYVAGLVLFFFAAATAGEPVSLALVLGWEEVRGDTTTGFVNAFVLVLTGGFVMALAIIALVSRSKLVPDFALTMHVIHIVVATVYTGALPRNLLWWLSMLASSAACIWLATWGCQYRELQPISFGGILGGQREGGGGGEASGHGRGASRNFGLPRRESPPRMRDEDEESEVGFLRGTGRGGRQGSRGGNNDFELSETGRSKR